MLHFGSREEQKESRDRCTERLETLDRFAQRVKSFKGTCVIKIH